MSKPNKTTMYGTKAPLDIDNNVYRRIQFLADFLSRPFGDETKELDIPDEASTPISAIELLALVQYKRMRDE